jgi:type II secretory pathway component PulJ
MISPKRNEDSTTIFVSLEVVSKLSRRDQEHIEQLLRLCVTCFSVGRNLAHVIYRSLNRIGLPFLFSLGNENRADHISGGRDVE